MRLKFTCPKCGGHEFSIAERGIVCHGCHGLVLRGERWKHFALHPENEAEFSAMQAARIGHGAAQFMAEIHRAISRSK